MQYALICHPAINHRSETISSSAYFSFVIQSLFDIVKLIINLSLRISNPACLYFSHVCVSLVRHFLPDKHKWIIKEAEVFFFGGGSGARKKASRLFPGMKCTHSNQTICLHKHINVQSLSTLLDLQWFYLFITICAIKFYRLLQSLF